MTACLLYDKIHKNQAENLLHLMLYFSYPADAEENQLTESGNFVIIIGLSSGFGSFCPPLRSAK